MKPQSSSLDVRFVNPVVFVQDINISKKFYAEVIGLKIVEAADVFVLFEGHFSIHQAHELVNTIFGKASEAGMEPQGRNNLLLYFESGNLEATFTRLEKQVRFVHPIVQQAWGQRVFRFYDPDGHIVEIGEPPIK